MEQAEFTEHQLDVQAHSHHDFEEDTERPEDRPYMANSIVWGAVMAAAIALLIVGVVGATVALLFFNYTSGGFS